MTSTQMCVTSAPVYQGIYTKIMIVMAFLIENSHQFLKILFAVLYVPNSQ
jgi:hypothetical protein